MRIRRTILAPALLALSAVGSLTVGSLPVLAAVATPSASAVAFHSVSPDFVVYHG
jgi:hypothetical protein